MLPLTPVMKKFILHWGEMGTRWGVNRTEAQVHALLYLAPEPLNAEQIAETLSVARSNVSSSLHELESWGIVKSVHVFGDRREYFEAMKDVWEMARIILDERRRREIDPTLALLGECVRETDPADPGDKLVKERVAEMLKFVEALTRLHGQLRGVPTPRLRSVLKAGGGLGKLLGKRREKGV